MVAGFTVMAAPVVIGGAVLYGAGSWFFRKSPKEKEKHATREAYKNYNSLLNWSASYSSVLHDEIALLKKKIQEVSSHIQ